LRQALAYDTLYKRTQRLGDEEIQSFVLSAKKPNAEFLAAFGYEQDRQTGVYYSPYRLLQLVPILPLSELVLLLLPVDRIEAYLEQVKRKRKNTGKRKKAAS
jgi:hypothetical protein